MSKKTSKQAVAPPVSTSVLPYEDFLRLFQQNRINTAIEKVTQWPAVCPGPCLPPQYRSWMVNPAFQVA